MKIPAAPDLTSVASTKVEATRTKPCRWCALWCPVLFLCSSKKCICQVAMTCPWRSSGKCVPKNVIRECTSPQTATYLRMTLISRTVEATSVMLVIGTCGLNMIGMSPKFRITTDNKIGVPSLWCAGMVVGWCPANSRSVMTINARGSALNEDTGSILLASSMLATAIPVASGPNFAKSIAAGVTLEASKCATSMDSSLALRVGLMLLPFVALGLGTGAMLLCFFSVLTFFWCSFNSWVVISLILASFAMCFNLDQKASPSKWISGRMSFAGILFMITAILACTLSIGTPRAVSAASNALVTSSFGLAPPGNPVALKRKVCSLQWWTATRGSINLPFCVICRLMSALKLATTLAATSVKDAACGTYMKVVCTEKGSWISILLSQLSSGNWNGYANAKVVHGIGWR